MHKFPVWTASFTANFALWLFFPRIRHIISPLITAHIPIAIWGGSNIRSNFFCTALYRLKGEKKRLALTFDDGPDPNITPQILDLLNQYHLKATFFVIGKKAQENPDLVKLAFSQKHTIANHDLNHDLISNFRFSRHFNRDIEKANQIVKQITGLKPALYRPPVGLTNPHINSALKKLSMNCVGWEKSVRDGGNRRKETFCRFTQLAKPGAVILLHDTLPNTEFKEIFLENLEQLFITIRDSGFESVGVDTLFGIRPYK